MHSLTKLLVLILLIFSARPVYATVLIFEAGFGQDETTWQPLLKALPDTYKVVTYTRQSIADPAAKPTSIAQDVSHLLKKVKQYQGEEILLVGHSYGGLVVAEAALLAPELIDGVILLEPTVRSQRKQFQAIDRARIAADDALLKKYIPPRLAPQLELLMQQLDDSAIDSYPLPVQLPVVLVTSTRVEPEPLFFEETAAGKQQWLALHQALIANSEEALHIRSRHFGHNPHIEAPAMVAATILQLIEQLH
ncbi:alpha/beta fold hydrolase [Alteromonas lipolytica]|uniref:AB hydrolase-1 domain-containing protein n=1 Tax=Alteromonas lipolytica TaxID=1856405 RepID=A0A1E8FK15_9ALTE|nr:alpha/beta hydrolase [Alteromonas lipolytica]OFI36262.1 hypothetical protein BFC17_09070 [Alteromonas lipolytica]GGF79207.1 hypothetical protein GCM10011338_34460 [Alteromonas lipolytica]